MWEPGIRLGNHQFVTTPRLPPPPFIHSAVSLGAMTSQPARELGPEAGAEPGAEGGHTPPAHPLLTLSLSLTSARPAIIFSLPEAVSMVPAQAASENLSHFQHNVWRPSWQIALCHWQRPGGSLPPVFWRGFCPGVRRAPESQISRECSSLSNYLCARPLKGGPFKALHVQLVCL